MIAVVMYNTENIKKTSDLYSLVNELYCKSIIDMAA